MNSGSVYVIAEIGVNHNGSVEIAKRLIDDIAASGCDAVKFQLFKTEDIVTRRAEKAAYQIENTANNESQYDMLKRLELSEEAFFGLKQYCDERKVDFLATPFDKSSVDVLERLDVPAYKIGSGDLTNMPLLVRVARTGKPMIVSTGMADLEEVAEALSWIGGIGPVPVTLLHCTSSYPTAYGEVNMKAMQALSNHFNCDVGYSDHTVGLEIPIMAVAMGAKVIEKHVTLDRSMAGPDHRASLETKDLSTLVSMIRHVESAFGCSEKRMCESERETAIAARKSIVSNRKLKKGEVIEEKDISIKRPGTGLAPKRYDWLLGRVVAKDVDSDTPLQERDVEV